MNDHILHVSLRNGVVQLEVVCKAHPPAICRPGLACVAAEAINAEPVEDSYIGDDAISLWDDMPVLVTHDQECGWGWVPAPVYPLARIEALRAQAADMSERLASAGLA